MAGMLRESNGKGGDFVVSKFIGLLAHRLSEDTESSSLLESSNLEVLLRQSAQDLPAGKLRSTLLREDLSKFVAAVRDEIKAARGISDLVSVESGETSARLDFVEGSFLTEKDYLKLVAVVVDKVKSGLAEGNQAAELCLGARRLLLARKDPPLQLVWATATLEMTKKSTPHPKENKESTVLPSIRRLLRCLKALIVGHTSVPTAVAALAPVVPVMFKAVKEISKSLGFLKDSTLGRASIDTNAAWKKARKNIKAMQAMVREILSFIVVCRNKEKCRRDSFSGLRSAPTHCQSLSPALISLSLLLRALKVSETPAESDILVGTERLKVMFPLVSKPMVKSLSQPNLKVGDISDFVTIEVVLLQLVLELIHCRSRLKIQGGTFEAAREGVMATMKTIAVHCVAPAVFLSIPHGNDLILDILLLSRLPVGNALDNEEEATLRMILYEAVLVEQPRFGLMDMVASSTSTVKDSSIFLKRIAAARKAIFYSRSLGERSRSIDLQAVVSTLHVPPWLVEWLKMAKVKQKPSEDVLTSPLALIGWLIHLEEAEFKATFDRVSMYASKLTEDRVEGTSTIDDRYNHDRDAECNSISFYAISQEEPEEDIFFVDTKGEGKDKGSEVVDTAFTAAVADMRGKRSMMRKEQNVLFHRDRRVADSKKTGQSLAECDSDFNLNDVTEESKDMKNNKRRRKGDKAAASVLKQGDTGAITALLEREGKEANLEAQDVDVNDTDSD